jgi:hypothetical protein
VAGTPADVAAVARVATEVAWQPPRTRVAAAAALIARAHPEF